MSKRGGDVFDRMDGLLKQGTAYMNVELIYIDLEAAKRAQVASVLSFCAIGATGLLHRVLGVPMGFVALLSFVAPACWLYERFVRNRERRRRLVGYLWAVHSMDRWALREEDFFSDWRFTDDSVDALKRALRTVRAQHNSVGKIIASPGQGIAKRPKPLTVFPVGTPNEIRSTDPDDYILKDK